jgi:hypothetical protein
MPEETEQIVPRNQSVHMIAGAVFVQVLILHHVQAIFVTELITRVIVSELMEQDAPELLYAQIYLQAGHVPLKVVAHG